MHSTHTIHPSPQNSHTQIRHPHHQTSKPTFHVDTSAPPHARTAFHVDTSTRRHVDTSAPPHLHTSALHSTSTRRHVDTSARRHVDTSARPHLRTSAPPHCIPRRHVDTSTRRHVDTSARPHLRTSARPHVRTSARRHVAPLAFYDYSTTFANLFRIAAGVVKLVDIPDLGSGAARHGGSSPSTRTFPGNVLNTFCVLSKSRR